MYSHSLAGMKPRGHAYYNCGYTASVGTAHIVYLVMCLLKHAHFQLDIIALRCHAFLQEDVTPRDFYRMRKCPDQAHVIGW